MAPELIYFIKVNVAIALFYLFYRLFIHKDTFFKSRRFILLAFLVVSLFYPLLNIQEWVQQQEVIYEMAYQYAFIITPEIQEAELTPTGITWEKGVSLTLLAIYLGGVIVLGSRFLVQIFHILFLNLRCRKTTIQDIEVRILKREEGPFSFFRWIFIYPFRLQNNKVSEILAHEQAHVRQWHSIDVIACELATVFFWFNPFIWYTRKEIKNNLEYLADEQVVSSGYNRKDYQYHLLELTQQMAAAPLYNNFKVLPLKNRITMMNKKRTGSIHKTKYFALLPLAALLLLISNIEIVARTTVQLTKEVINTEVPQDVVKNGSDQQEQAENVKLDEIIVVGYGHEDAPQTPLPIKEEQDPVLQDDLFQVVEEMPQYPGGTSALMEFIAKNIRYPEEARKKGIQGRVIAQFTVEKDGSLSDMKVVRKVDDALDEEALRIISSMPKWEPGKQRGQLVRVRYTLPIVFKLDGQTPPSTGSTPPATIGPDTDDVFQVVEQMPEFPGGNDALMQFLADNIKYPENAKNAGIQGRVIANYVVNKDGTISRAQIVRSVDPELDAEALRVISIMPKWNPGKQRGRDVNVKYTIPIIFKL